MTVEELRESLLRAMRLADEKKGAWAAPRGLEAAIRALPDTRLVDALPRDMAEFIRHELKKCERSKALVSLVAGMQREILMYYHRMREQNLPYQEAMIAILSPDYWLGLELAKKLLGADTPYTEWARLKQAGEMPLSMGLVSRPTFQEELAATGHPAAQLLAELDEVAIVAVAYESVGVFGLAPEWLNPGQA